MLFLNNVKIKLFHCHCHCHCHCNVLNFEVDRKVYFNNIYDCILTKTEYDLIWKIRHGAIPTGRFLYGYKYLDSPNCNYCGEFDDLTNIFVTCSRLSGFVSQQVLVLMLMLDAHTTGFLRRQK